MQAMNDSWFWRVLAVLGLLVALGYVVSRFTSAPPVRAAGQGGFIMEVSYDQGGIGRVYLLDANRKCLIMYGSAARHDITMFSSRYVELDCQATIGKEFPGRPRGWPLLVIQKEIQKEKARGRRPDR